MYSKIRLIEIFDVIQHVHTTVGHRGIRSTLKKIKTKHINVT
jgi:hypothetical protein